MAYCSKCGAKLDDGFVFCVSCGARVAKKEEYEAPVTAAEAPAPAVEQPAPAADITAPAPAEQPAVKKQRPKWLIPVIAGVLVLALALAAVCIFVLPGLRSGEKDDRQYVNYIGTDGSLNIVYDDGSVKTTEGNFDKVYENIKLDMYVILEDDELYTVSRSMEDKRELSDECEKVSNIIGNCIVFVEDGNTVICDLVSGDSAGIEGSGAFSYECGYEDGDPEGAVSDIFFSIDNKGVWHFSAEDCDVEPLCDFEENTAYRAVYCSADASLVFYSAEHNNVDFLYEWKDGESTEIDRFNYGNRDYDSNYSYYFGTCSRRADVGVIGNPFSNRVFMVKGTEYVPAEIEGKFDYSVLVDGGELRQYDSEEAPDGVWIMGNKDYGSYDGDMKDPICYVNFDGDVENTVDTAYYSAAILDGTLYYFSGRNELSCASVSGSKIKGAAVVDDHVVDIRMIGDSLYYLADCESVDEENRLGKGSVYRINPDLEEPVRIDKKASCWYQLYERYDGPYESGIMYMPGFETQDSIFTLHGYKYIDEENNKWKATLVMCSKDGDDWEELDDIFGYNGYVFDNGNIVFEQFVKEKKGEYIVDVIFCDGSGLSTILEDILG